MLFLSLTRKTISTRLGEENASLPAFVLGDQWVDKIRLTEEIGGTEIEVDREVVEIKASLGFKDARPTGGEFKLRVGPGPTDANNTTGSIEFDFSDDGAPDAFTAAFNEANSTATYGTAANAYHENGSIIFDIGDGSTLVELEVADNCLAPVSFVRILPFQVCGKWRYEVRLRQAPAATTSSFDQVVPVAPKIEVVQDGSEPLDGYKLPEIQDLIFNPEFRGAIALALGSRQTEPFLQSIGAAALKDLLDGALTEPGEGQFFEVGIARNNVPRITFRGSFVGEDQDPLTVSVVSHPPGDYQVELDLDDRPAHVFLRGGEVENVPFEIEVSFKDPQDTDRTHRLTFQTTADFRMEQLAEDLDVLSIPDYRKPPLPASYVPWEDDQVRTGIQFWEGSFPQTGQTGQSTFNIPHGLNTRALAGVWVVDNAAGGRLLVHGIDYTITNVQINAVDLNLLGGPATTVGEYGVVISGAEPTDQFLPHGHTLEQFPWLAAILAEMRDDIDSLLGQTSNKFRRSDDLLTFNDTKKIRPFGRVLPLELRPVIPAEGVLFDAFDQSLLPSLAADLLPAIHDATVEDLPILDSNGFLTVATPGVSDIGVYQSQSASEVTLPGGRGRAQYRVQQFEYVICDGRYWYPASRYISSENSFYPASFERTLFESAVTSTRLVSGRRLEVLFQVELATIDAATAYHYTLAIEVGTFPQDDAPSPTGPNLQNVIWQETPIFEERIPVMGTPDRFDFGFRVDREGDELAASALQFADWVEATAPTSLDFAYRARLIRPDTENSKPGARGFIWINGPVFEGAQNGTGEIRISN